jgi:hypothetical protein
MSKLTIELIPSSCWFTNVRTLLPSPAWDLLKKSVYKKAHYRCQICKKKGADHPVECHEIWEYDDEKKIQYLKGLIALCPACHAVKHLGFSYLTAAEEGSKAVHHLAAVNHWTLVQAQQYVQECFKQWEWRSQFEWEVNLDWLKASFIIARTQRFCSSHLNSAGERSHLKNEKR